MPPACMTASSLQALFAGARQRSSGSKAGGSLHNRATHAHAWCRCDPSLTRRNSCSICSARLERPRLSATRNTSSGWASNTCSSSQAEQASSTEDTCIAGHECVGMARPTATACNPMRTASGRAASGVPKGAAALLTAPASSWRPAARLPPCQDPGPSCRWSVRLPPPPRRDVPTRAGSLRAAAQSCRQ